MNIKSSIIILFESDTKKAERKEKQEKQKNKNTFYKSAKSMPAANLLLYPYTMQNEDLQYWITEYFQFLPSLPLTW